MNKLRFTMAFFIWVILLALLLTGCAKGINSGLVIPQNEDTTQSGTVIDAGNTESTVTESSSTASTVISEAVSAVDIAKAKPVAELFTYISIPGLTVSLGELYANEKYYAVDWIEFDTMVKLSVQRQSTSNTIVFCFSKVGDSLDFPQVSTMLITNDGGTQEVRWSFDNIDNALIEILLADGYITDTGGYQVTK